VHETSERPMDADPIRMAGKRYRQFASMA
jgi:hypothetical protein